jgi:hypothetical protein
MHGPTRETSDCRCFRVVHVECIGCGAVDALLRALGCPDVPDLPGWEETPDGTPFIVLRVILAKGNANGPGDGSLRVFNGHKR